jgi:arylsulfatase A-like enzyme
MTAQLLRLLLLLLPAVARAEHGSTSAGRKNMLFFIADDLRPQLNKAYGQAFMHTPAFDKFAGEALTFDYAFTNFGICSASRNR